MSEQTFYRVSTPELIVRNEDSDTPIVEGMVVPYGQWSEVDSIMEGRFIERFAAGSLTKSFAESFRRVKGYFEHGLDRVFGRAPIMDIQETWETDEGAFFRAQLLKGLPDYMLDGIRRGLYGASLGAKELPGKTDRVRWPRPSDYNPKGIEERTYRELRANDISLTPRPHYEEAAVMMRSITDDLRVLEGQEGLDRLIVARMAEQEPDRLLEILRSTAEVQEAEPEHSQPEEPEAPQEPEAPEAPEDQPADEPEAEGSRTTRHVKDYLADESEDTWRV